ncbi:MAG: HDOD domain-containing protein [Candidatus Accumulibacter sp. UW26]|jgi:EAL and modified HD-GYP domain-containing signal transduction protein
MSWWDRFFARKSPRVASAAATQEVASLPDEPPKAELASGGQRPLVGINGDIAGFGFRLPLAISQRQAEGAGVHAATARAISLLSAMRPTLASGRIALGELPGSLLCRATVASQVPEGAWLAIQGGFDPAADTAGLLRQWRARGVTLGNDGGSEPEGSRFVLLRPMANGLADVLEAAARWQQLQPGRVLVAVDLESVDAIEEALAQGVMLAAGCLAAGPQRMRERPLLQPAAYRLCKLLNEVALDRSDAQIGAELRADLTLSYRLLRFVNSPALGLTRSVESVEQSVMILGRRELYRWLSVLLLSSGLHRKTSRALQEVAMARARLLELLASASPDQDPPAALFTVGLLSMLDTLLQVPLADALQPINLSTPAQQALLSGSGPWGHYLELAITLERHDLAAAEILAARFGGLALVLALSDEAWAWSAGLARAQDS